MDVYTFPIQINPKPFWKHDQFRCTLRSAGFMGDLLQLKKKKKDRKKEKKRIRKKEKEKRRNQTRANRGLKIEGEIIYI